MCLFLHRFQKGHIFLKSFWYWSSHSRTSTNWQLSLPFFSVKLYLRDERTDSYLQSNLVHFSLKMWHLVAIFKWFIKFRVFIGWSRILSFSLKFLWSIVVRPPRMGQTDRDTSQSVCPFIRCSLRCSLTLKAEKNDPQAWVFFFSKIARLLPAARHCKIISRSGVSANALYQRSARRAAALKPILVVIDVDYFGEYLMLRSTIMTLRPS